MIKTVVSVILIFPLVALSYIPQSHTIYKKTTANNGSGIYEIVQEVIFKNSKDKLIITEVWTVENGINLSLIATGKDFHFRTLYKNGTKYYADLNGQIKTSNYSDEFFENIFHFRKPIHFAKYLAQLQIIPEEAAKQPARFYNIKDVEYKAEAFLRLSRTNGLVAYGFGKLSEPDNKQTYPRLWIEQDQFRVLRFRLPTNVEVESKNFAKYSKGFYFARNKSVKWNDNITPIRVLRADHKASSKIYLAKLDINNFKRTKSKARVGNTDLHKVALNFYKRFR